MYYLEGVKRDDLVLRTSSVTESRHLKRKRSRSEVRAKMAVAGKLRCLSDIVCCMKFIFRATTLDNLKSGSFRTKYCRNFYSAGSSPSSFSSALSKGSYMTCPYFFIRYCALCSKRTLQSDCKLFLQNKCTSTFESHISRVIGNVAHKNWDYSNLVCF